MPDTLHELTFSRFIAAPREVLWRCWTEPELIRQWFTPRPWTTPVVEVDVRPGGRSHMIFRGPDGEEFPNDGVYLEVVPNEKLVFTDTYTVGWKPAPEPFMTAILTFQDIGQGRTLYTAVARHRNADTAKSHADMGFFDGWGTVATQLEAYARGLLK